MYINRLDVGAKKLIIAIRYNLKKYMNYSKNSESSNKVESQKQIIWQRLVIVAVVQVAGCIHELNCRIEAILPSKLRLLCNIA